MKSKLYIISLLAVAFVSGIAFDRLWQPDENLTMTMEAPAVEHSITAEEIEHAKKHLDPNYVCPMHPQIQSGQPGTCPICGMDLVAREAGKDSGADASVVTITPGVAHNLGVRTARVKRGTLARRVDTMGIVSKIAASRNADVKPGIDGRLEWVTMKKPGDRVHAGDPLFQVYSPERIALQKEYLAAWDEQETDLLPDLWTRLRAAFFTDPEIKQLEEDHVIRRTYLVPAPQPGILVSNRGYTGARVSAGSRIMTIGGYKKVDANAEVFERHWSWLEVGQTAEMSLPALPGETFQGHVEAVNKAINFKTRSLTTRLSFVSLSPRIREGMVANMTIFAQPRNAVMYIPRDALIRTGQQARVVKALGNGRYEPVIVEPGIESGDEVEIVSGLKDGDEVVVSGQFLIDSESSLSASFRRMNNDNTDNGASLDKISDLPDNPQATESEGTH